MRPVCPICHAPVTITISHGPHELEGAWVCPDCSTVGRVPIAINTRDPRTLPALLRLVRKNQRRDTP